MAIKARQIRLPGPSGILPVLRDVDSVIDMVAPQVQSLFREDERLNRVLPGCQRGSVWNVRWCPIMRRRAGACSTQALPSRHGGKRTICLLTCGRE
jgi:hypothetical protein